MPTLLSSPLFFCAIGGSGMLPLALMMKARGADVRGSDRGFDQGRTPERFAFIEKQGIKLFPQDGSGITNDLSRVIVSTAVEKTVPDYAAALEKNIPILHRAELLAELFNAAQTGIAVAGTSGKSTTTGMIGWILHACGRAPSIVNGAVMKNFVSPDMPFASAAVGDPDLFVAEVDESDGSIAHYAPRIAVLNNISLDHKSMEELRALFRAFLDKAETVVLNLDNAETAAMAEETNSERIFTYKIVMPAQAGIPFVLKENGPPAFAGVTEELESNATLLASDLSFRPDGVDFSVRYAKAGETARIRLQTPGAHNVSNALAALAAAAAAGVPFLEAAKALETFQGIARRLDVIGSVGGVTVIDDFAHNPDKIAATLDCLHQFEGRLLILFQPHGYGPLKLMKDELAACFVQKLGVDDTLYIPDPLYLGGTTDKSVGSAELAAAIGPKSRHIPSREACAEAILKETRSGDRVIVMGARDDTLPELAKNMLAKQGLKSPSPF